MNQSLRLIICVIGIGFTLAAPAQDTLPNFSVKNAGNNRMIIGWVNNFQTIKQISIQRSFDSLKNYKTILSVADPKAVQNGFADTKAPNDHMWYRLFYLLDAGKFYFTTAKKPVIDTTKTSVIPKEIKPEKINAVNKKPDGFVPSFYVYTNKDGYVFINLPDADQKKYSIKFFEENNNFLFELKPVKETALTLDKANFYRAGWYLFELYNDEKLVERHKFYLSKDF
ncbi:MAG: hypothetical protein ABR503_03880 [Chitinophagaceae bacterium]